MMSDEDERSEHSGNDPKGEAEASRCDLRPRTSASIATDVKTPIGPGDDGRTVGMRWRRSHGDVSLFELVPSRSPGSRRLPTSPIFNHMRGTLEVRSDEPRARLRRALADAERMLTSPRVSVTDALNYGRERTRMANAVDTSNEPDIHPDPRLLSAGGQMPYAGRLDPLTEKCDNARAAGIDRGRTGQNEAAGPRRDEFHSYITICMACDCRRHPRTVFVTTTHMGRRLLPRGGG